MSVHIEINLQVMSRENELWGGTIINGRSGNCLHTDFPFANVRIDSPAEPWMYLPSEALAEARSQSPQSGTDSPSWESNATNCFLSSPYATVVWLTEGGLHETVFFNHPLRTTLDHPLAKGLAGLGLECGRKSRTISFFFLMF